MQRTESDGIVKLSSKSIFHKWLFLLATACDWAGIIRKRTQCNGSIHLSLLSAILLDGLVSPYSFMFLLRQTQRVAVSPEERHGK